MLTFIYVWGISTFKKLISRNHYKDYIYIYIYIEEREREREGGGLKSGG